MTLIKYRFMEYSKLLINYINRDKAFQAQKKEKNKSLEEKQLQRIIIQIILINRIKEKISKMKYFILKYKNNY